MAAEADRVAETLDRVGVVEFAGNAVETAFSPDGTTAYVSNFRRGVVEVIDTVGAGDTFWGNCIGDWAQQASDAAQRVAATLAAAMQAAAINCTRAGCQPPRHAQVLAALGVG